MQLGVILTLPLVGELILEKGVKQTVKTMARVLLTGGPFFFMFHIRTKVHPEHLFLLLSLLSLLLSLLLSSSSPLSSSLPSLPMSSSSLSSLSSFCRCRRCCAITTPTTGALLRHNSSGRRGQVQGDRPRLYPGDYDDTAFAFAAPCVHSTW